MNIKALTTAAALGLSVIFAAPAQACPITDWLDARGPLEAQLNGSVTIAARDCKIIRDLVNINKEHQKGVLSEIRYNGGSSNFSSIRRENNKLWTMCKSWGVKKARYEKSQQGGWAPVGSPCADGLGQVYAGGFDTMSCLITL